jgi:hypothetical protein
MNTREYRTRKKLEEEQKLEEERHKLIQEAIKLNPEFKPPIDYKYSSLFCTVLLGIRKLHKLQFTDKFTNNSLAAQISAP